MKFFFGICKYLGVKRGWCYNEGFKRYLFWLELYKICIMLLEFIFFKLIDKRFSFVVEFFILLVGRF